MLVPVIYVIALAITLVSLYLTPRVRFFDKFTWAMFILFLPFIGIFGWFTFGPDRSPEGELDDYDTEPVSPDDDGDVIEGELQ